MKKYQKRLLICCGIFFAVGMVLCTAGWILGFRPVSYLQSYQKEKRVLQEGSLSTIDAITIPAEDNLELSIGAAVCRLTVWDGDEIAVKISDHSLLEVDHHNSKVEICYGANHHSLLHFAGKDADLIWIALPEKKVFQKLSLEAGASEVTAEGVACKKLDLECGAGKIIYKGRVEESCKTECGAGSIQMFLEGSEEDFSYDMECGLGSICVGNGPSISGIGEHHKNGPGNKKMDLECGLGSIRVDFQEAGQATTGAGASLDGTITVSEGISHEKEHEKEHDADSHR